MLLLDAVWYGPSFSSLFASSLPFQSLWAICFYAELIYHVRSEVCITSSTESDSQIGYLVLILTLKTISVRFVLSLNRLKARRIFFAKRSASFTSNTFGKFIVGNNVGIAMPPSNFIKQMCNYTPYHFWTATFLDLLLHLGHSGCLRFHKQWREPSNISPEMRDLTRNQESFISWQSLTVSIRTFLNLAPKNTLKNT